MVNHKHNRVLLSPLGNSHDVLKTSGGIEARGHICSTEEHQTFTGNYQLIVQRTCCVETRRDCNQIT